MRAAIATALLVLLAAGAAGAAFHPTETVRLAPLGGSHVTATATLGGNERGTSVVIAARGFRSHQNVRAIVRAGSCAHPSASFADAGTAVARPDGVVHITATVRFHGSQAVAWTTIANGAHTVALVAGGRVVACGAIPGVS